MKSSIEKFQIKDGGSISALHKHTLCCIAHSMAENRYDEIYENKDSWIDCSILEKEFGKGMT